MKKLTNHTLGPRGVNTKGGTVWIEPGEAVEIDEKEIVGSLPDLGKKSSASAPGESEEVKALIAQVADLTKQVEALETEKAELAELGEESAKEVDALQKANADLTKQVEALKKTTAK